MNVLRILFSYLSNSGFSRMFDLIINPDDPYWGDIPIVPDSPPEVVPENIPDSVLDSVRNTIQDVIAGLEQIHVHQQSTPWLLVAIVIAIVIFAIIMVVRILRKRKAVSD